MGLGEIITGLVFSDEQAMSRVKAHDDHRSFARLVEKWEGPVRNLCVRMTGDPHRGEDLKQETFARLYQKCLDYEPTGKFSSYLWRMALNLCYDELRRAKSRPAEVSRDEAKRDETHDVCEDHASPSEQAARSEEGQMVRAAVQSLPEIYRVVVILRHYENLKMREIAEVLDLPPGTVHSRLAEGLGRMARRLEPHFSLKEQRPPLRVCVPGPPETSLL